ncbi:Drug resistance protein [Fusarium oxysporum f. sp. albedinis]|nr:Drug resistance protein [Fusarium oxysporum f. sp. albedinis]
MNSEQERKANKEERWSQGENLPYKPITPDPILQHQRVKTNWQRLRDNEKHFRLLLHPNRQPNRYRQDIGDNQRGVVISRDGQQVQ